MCWVNMQSIQGHRKWTLVHTLISSFTDFFKQSCLLVVFQNGGHMTIWPIGDFLINLRNFLKLYTKRLPSFCVNENFHGRKSTSTAKISSPSLEISSNVTRAMNIDQKRQPLLKWLEGIYLKKTSCTRNLMKMSAIQTQAVK